MVTPLGTAADTPDRPPVRAPRAEVPVLLLGGPCHGERLTISGLPRRDVTIPVVTNPDAPRAERKIVQVIYNLHETTPEGREAYGAPCIGLLPGTVPW